MKVSFASRRSLVVLAATWYFVVLGSLTIAAQVVAPGQDTPTGKRITPTAVRGAVVQDLNPGLEQAPDVRADGPASLAVSPDGRKLAILAGGYNRFADKEGRMPPELSNDLAFIFDITQAQPRQMQAIPVHASFVGLAWAPSSDRLFVSGGIDDTVQQFVQKDSAFVAAPAIHLGHKAWNGQVDASSPTPCPGCLGEVGGLALSPGGKRLLVANMMNDSVSLVDPVRGQVIVEQDLRPGKNDPARHGVAGGSYPRAVVWISPTRAYVASERDREVIALEITKEKVHILGRLPVPGQPVALLANRAGSRLYAALDTTNQVAIFDTGRNRLIEMLDVVAPEAIFHNGKGLGGANSNALVLTPDERTLLVSNGGENAIAVVALGEQAQGAHAKRPTSDREGEEDARDGEHSKVLGLVPTGWYPSGIGISKDGKTWYVVNGKSPTGPNSSWCKTLNPVNHTCQPRAGFQYDTEGDFKGGWPLMMAVNQHLQQLEKATLQTFPAPSLRELAALTKQVATNNHFDEPAETATQEELFTFLRKHIKHVLYIMKENRAYDEILGDLDVGNGDPRLTLFPEPIAPNHHAIARDFVDLDNTMVSGEGSPQGWTWTYAAQTTDYNERNEPHSYANRGANDLYGNNRQLNMGYATSAERHAQAPSAPTDPDILPGIKDVNAPDGPSGTAGKGYIWDVALAHGLTVRNWGLAPSIQTFHTLVQVVDKASSQPPLRDPFAQRRQIMWTTKSALIPNTDPYYYPCEPRFPDYWRMQEWKREFSGFVTAGSAPNLMVMWLGSDHTGDFAHAIDGVDTPDTQVADNDYALGSIIQTIAESPFAKDTLIVSIEDDAWDGPDHVDSHRTIALFAGPYVRQHAVVSTPYNTVNVVKTIEEILGIGPIGLNDALAAPMANVFDPNQAAWSFKAIVPNVLRSTKLPLPPDDHAKIVFPRHSAAYWTKVTANQDFSEADRIEPSSFNRELWRGLKGPVPYPATRAGSDLKANGDHVAKSTGH
jgi:DNA-binding beta-propeller fold protein YncE